MTVDKTEEATDTTTEEDDDSALDDLIESIEEVVEAPAHWLFRKMFGKKD
jgi:hypothetical protein